MLIGLILENRDLIIVLTIVTGITIVTSIVIIPYIILNLTPDYFLYKRQPMFKYKHRFIRYFVLIIKNVFGYILFLLGIIMLFIPGQGLLSIALGILLINFPGKKKVEKKMFSNKKVNKIINIIRNKFGKEEIFFSYK